MPPDDDSDGGGGKDYRICVRICNGYFYFPCKRKLVVYSVGELQWQMMRGLMCSG